MFSAASKAIASVHSFFSPRKEMSASQNMATFASRLATFDATGAKPKGRPSNSKGSRASKWPHKSPTPAELAQAGFYFEPSVSSPDNVTCVSCLKSLDGWESEDDPIMEHLAYSPECGVAIHAGLEREVKSGAKVVKNPMCEEMIAARKATFGDFWPHERKRGWICKIQKMAEAGWYYCPMPDSGDFVKCGYCSLGLDDWQPKDNPLEEHLRRSANCTFFTFAQPSKSTLARAKKGRGSKTARLSIQSTASVEHEDMQMLVVNADNGDDTVITNSTEITLSPNTQPSVKKKNGRRPRKGTAKPRTSNDTLDMDAEQENDGFQVKVDNQPKEEHRGKKRSSATAPLKANDQANPMPKRRAIRTRSSTLNSNLIQPDKNIEHSTRSEAITASEQSELKKNIRGKAGPSSATSKTSMPSLTAKPPSESQMSTDNEIDAALEADLDRPLSDEERLPQLPHRGSKSKIKKASGIAQPPKAPPVAEATNHFTTSEESQQNDESTSHQVEHIESLVEPNVSKMHSIQYGEDMIESMDSPKILPDPETRQINQIRGLEDVALDQKKPTRSNQQTILDEASDLITTTESQQKPIRGRGRKRSRKSSEDNLVSEKLGGKSADHHNVAKDDTFRITDETLYETNNSQDRIKRGRAVKKVLNPPLKRGRKPKRAVTNKKGPEITIECSSNEATENGELFNSDIRENPELDDSRDDAPKRQKSSEDKFKDSKMSIEDNRNTVLEKEGLLQSEKEAMVVVQYTNATKGIRNVIQTGDAGESSTLEPSWPGNTPQKTLVVKQIPSPTPSPQSSDAENQPPSSRPSAVRPPLIQISPSKANTTRVQISASTPIGTSKINISRLQTEFHWSTINIEEVLNGSPRLSGKNEIEKLGSKLTNVEKMMTLEEWILQQAKIGEERLREECEGVVGKFESEGLRALKALEGIVTFD